MLYLRIIAVLLLPFLLSAVENVKILTALFIPVLVLFLYQQYRTQNLKKGIKFLLIFNLFTLFLWLTLPWQWQNGWHYTPQGTDLALLLTIKINTITLVIRVLLHQITELQLLALLDLPFLSPKFARLMILTVRYIKLLGETNQNLHRAMLARGFQVKCSRRTFYVIAQRVALLLIHALHKAEMVDRALRARGFQYNKVRKND